MDYLEYFTQFPDAYAKVVSSFNRTETLYHYLVEKGLLDDGSTILSIGPGDGEVEIRLAKEWKQQLGIVEPARLLFDQFMSNAQTAGIQSGLLDVQQQSFEEFQTDRKYDLVLSLFSWFAFGFNRQLLEKALSYRTTTGKLLICLQSETCPSTRISAVSQSTGINLTSEALSEWATREGYAHEYDLYHGYVPTARFLVEGELTQTGKDFASFVSATPWDELPGKIKSVALDSLLRVQQGDQIDFACGCLIFETPR